MPIKNYTTEINPVRTAGQISELLAAHGARAIQIEYAEGGRPAGLTFAVDVLDRRFGYKLPARADGVLAALKKDRRVKPRHRTIEHARCVAWRIVFDWVTAQLALIEAGAADLGEVFLPYLMTSPTETIYDRFLSGGGMLALLPSEKE